jgi:hypothetical protein
MATVSPHHCSYCGDAICSGCHVEGPVLEHFWFDPVSLCTVCHAKLNEVEDLVHYLYQSKLREKETEPEV